MAVDTGLPLRIAQANQPQDPLAQYGKALALKNMLQQGQIGQQQLQEGQIGLQQKQLLFDDQQKISKVLSDPSVNGNIEKAIPLLGPAGVSGQSILSITKGLDDHREKIATTSKAVADAAKANQEVDTQQKGLVDDMLQGLASNPNATAADLLSRAHILTATSPSLTPKIAPIIQQIQNAPDPDAAARQIVQSAMGQKAQSVAAGTRKNTAEAAGLEAKIPGEQAQSEQQVRSNLAAKLGAATSQAEYQKILGAAPFEIAREFDGKTPEQARKFGLTSEQQTQAEQAATNQQNEQKQRQITNGLAQGRLSVEQADLELKKQQFGFDTNGGISPTAQLAAQGKIDPQTLRGIVRRNPGIISQIQKVDPDFDEANIDSRYNTLKEFNNTSTGKAGGQVIALNTLIHHADLYRQTAEALKNGSFVPGNAAYNAVASAFGSAPPTNAALVARFLAGETGKVATGGVPAEGEINGILKSLGTSASPDQIAQAGKTLLQVAAGRATPLMERVNQAKLGNTVQVIGPDAQQILQRNGFDPKTMKPAAAAPSYKAGDTVNYQGKPHKVTAVGADGKLTLEP